MGGRNYIDNTGKAKGGRGGGRGGGGGRGDGRGYRGRRNGGESGKECGGKECGGGDGDGDGDGNLVGVAGGPAEDFAFAKSAAPDNESDDFWEDTVSWLHKEMLGMPIAKDYPDILAESVVILTKWRDTFPKAVWIRVVKSGRIAKVGRGKAPSGRAENGTWSEEKNQRNQNNLRECV